MAIPVIMPRQGQSVESCIIGQWHKKAGDPVKAGDTLFTYETDKATFDEAAKDDGILLAVFYEEGDDVPCLLNVCVIGQPGEDFSAFAPAGESASSAESDAAASETSITNEIPAETAPAELATAVAATASTISAVSAVPEIAVSENIGAISPRARNLAEKTHADLRFAVPTGPKGRIIERDVEQLIFSGKLATPAAGSYAAGIAGTGIGGRVSVQDAEAPASGTVAGSIQQSTDAPAGSYTTETTTEKHSNIRKVIAKSMQASLSQMAQLTLNTSFDATDILEFRAKLKKANTAGLTTADGFPLAEQIPTINDIILYTVSRVLLRYRECNAHYDDEKMTFFNHVHLGVAADTPRGLMVPTLFYADVLSLSEIAVQVREIVGACREGSISPDLLKDGTFTVTNLGTLGIESFTPVINPPQTCILGVNTITTKIREVNGEIKSYSAIGLSLTFDHRALDGAPAGRFLKDLVKALENFSLFR